MIIMIEGVDGSGKTTLRKALAEKLNKTKAVKGIEEIIEDAELLIPTRPSQPERLNREELLNKLKDFATDNKRIYILDRGPISDIIYRTFDKHEPVLTLLEMLQVSLSTQLNSVIIFCDSDKSEEFMLKRGEDNPVSIQRHQELRYLYKQVMPLMDAITVDIFQYDKDNLNELTTLIQAVLFAKQQVHDTAKMYSVKRNENE